jgi:aquaporin Z
MRDALSRHWPEYLMEAAGLGAFMLSACVFAALLEHPASPIHHAIVSPLARRALMGIAMGLTAVGIIYSPWGQQSGAHLNPAVTLAFFRLGKIEPWDAAFYALAQFTGGIAGVALAVVTFGTVVRHPSVHYVATMPGAAGPWVALGAEAAISLGLMTTVLVVSNTPSLARFTGLFAGTLVAVYITTVAPISGMSMNPARTTASAVPAHMWSALWIYFVGPPLGMLLATEIHRRLLSGPVFCAKLHHHNTRRCIFRCAYPS